VSGEPLAGGCHSHAAQGTSATAEAWRLRRNGLTRKWLRRTEREPTDQQRRKWAPWKLKRRACRHGCRGGGAGKQSIACRNGPNLSFAWKKKWIEI